MADIDLEVALLTIVVEIHNHWLPQVVDDEIVVICETTGVTHRNRLHTPSHCMHITASAGSI